MRVRTPPDWAFLVRGGKVVTGAPDGGLGFIFTFSSGSPMLPNASVAQGVIGTLYYPPLPALQTILQAFGCREIKALPPAPDRARIERRLSAIRQQCEAQDIVARRMSAQGAECPGAMKLVKTQPPPGSGLSSSPALWRAENDFDRYLPLLDHVGRLSQPTVNTRGDTSNRVSPTSAGSNRKPLPPCRT